MELCTQDYSYEFLQGKLYSINYEIILQKLSGKKSKSTWIFQSMHEHLDTESSLSKVRLEKTVAQDLSAVR